MHVHKYPKIPLLCIKKRVNNVLKPGMGEGVFCGETYVYLTFYSKESNTDFNVHVIYN